MSEIHFRPPGAEVRPVVADPPGRVGLSADEFATLFDRHAAEIYRFCARRCGDPDLAQDLLSVTYLEAWRARGRFVADVRDTPLPWLMGIAVNVTRNTTRSRRRHAAAIARLPRPQPENDHADAVSARIDAQQELTAVLAALVHLPERDREVIQLVCWAGLSYEQTASALDVPVGTVRSRVARARRRLGTATGKADQ